MKTPLDLKNDSKKLCIGKYLEEEFNRISSKYERVSYNDETLLLVIPNDWVLEDIEIAEKYLKNFNWNLESIEEATKISKEVVDVKYLKISPMKSMTKEDLDILDAARVALLSEKIEIKNTNRVSVKNTESPYEEALKGENNGKVHI
jgi:hypothetical protein